METQKNFELFVSYIRKFIERDGVDEFIAWLVDCTDISLAPASTKYHMSEEGGLIKHSINVMKRMIKLINMEYGSIELSPFTKETIAFVSLFHDISKVNFYEKYTKNVKNQETGEWEQVVCYKVREPKDRLLYGMVEENSVYILQKFFKMSIEEASAIRWVEGYSNSNDSATISAVFNLYGTSTLAMLLHVANLMSICVDETSDEKMIDVEVPCKELEDSKEEDLTDEEDSLRPTPETLDCPF